MIVFFEHYLRAVSVVVVFMAGLDLPLILTAVMLTDTVLSSSRLVMLIVVMVVMMVLVDDVSMQSLTLALYSTV